MISIWLIGVIFSILALFGLKHSTKTTYIAGYQRTEVPVLRLWHVILIALCNLLPILNILIAVIFLLWWASIPNIEFTYTESKLFKFLNKPI